MHETMKHPLITKCFPGQVLCWKRYWPMYTDLCVNFQEEFCSLEMAIWEKFQILGEIFSPANDRKCVHGNEFGKFRKATILKILLGLAFKIDP